MEKKITQTPNPSSQSCESQTSFELFQNLSHNGDFDLHCIDSIYTDGYRIQEFFYKGEIVAVCTYKSEPDTMIFYIGNFITVNGDESKLEWDESQKFWNVYKELFAKSKLSLFGDVQSTERLSGIGEYAFYNLLLQAKNHQKKEVKFSGEPGALCFYENILSDFQNMGLIKGYECVNNDFRLFLRDE